MLLTVCLVARKYRLQDDERVMSIIKHLNLHASRLCSSDVRVIFEPDRQADGWTDSRHVTSHIFLVGDKENWGKEHFLEGSCLRYSPVAAYLSLTERVAVTFSTWCTSRASTRDA